MENTPGDSSSESDFSDPWSIIDRDSCESDDIQGEISGRESVNGEPSDGESLEVIEEEDRTNGDEFKDAGMETDGISIITDSEINEELDQSLCLDVNKERKYLHHPNTYLNTRLNVLLAISLAAVTGLGLGHFLGLQEECPINDSTSALLEKLQHENEMLKSQLKLLLKEETISGGFRKFDVLENDETLSHLTTFRNSHPISESEMKGRSIYWVDDSTNDNELHMRSDHTSVFGMHSESKSSEPISSSVLLSLVQNDRQIFHNGEEKGIIEGGEKQSDDILYNEYHDSDLIVKENKAPSHSTEYSVELNNEDPVKIVIGNADHFKESNQLYEEGESIKAAHVRNDDENININVDIPSNENLYTRIKSDFVAPIILTDKIFEQSSEDVPDKLFIHPKSEDNKASLDEINTSEHIIKDHVYEEESHIFPEAVEENKETISGEQSNLQLIKSTLKLLNEYFDSELSLDTRNIFPFAVKLADEHEQSFKQFHNSVKNCKTKTSDFCVKYEKKMETSITKLKETSEDLAEDIDEQLHKILNKIVRKLKKFKVNVQNKWCHIKRKNGMNDWFQASVLLDCKQDIKFGKKEHKKIFSNEPEKMYDKIITEHVKDEELLNPGNLQYDFKNIIINIDPEENKQGSTIKQKEHVSVLENSWRKNKDGKEALWKAKGKKEDIQKIHNGKINYKNFESKEHSQKIKSQVNHDWDNKKKVWKDQESERNNVDNLTQEKKPFWQGSHNEHRNNIILEQNGSWLSSESNTLQKHNISGDWILKMADGRAEQRKFNKKSDWIFDRADARKEKRGKECEPDNNWYFQRAHGREYCRYYSNSDWCKTEEPSNKKTHNWNHHNKYEYDGRSHHSSRWSKKFIPRTFAAAGKWFKDSFTNFGHKMNNYYHHSHH